MGRVTGWALLTWLKLTAALALGVVGVWLFADKPGYTLAAAVVAVLVDLWAITALAREWAYEARSSWWWSR
jgi:hypothetical protein